MLINNNNNEEANSKIIEWALQNAKNLDLFVIRYRWPERFDLPFFDCKVQIQVRGKKFFGRGTADSENVSFIKGLSEALERAIFEYSDARHTNGFAAHISEEAAIDSAKCECLERDTFFCHFLTKTPFLKKIELSSQDKEGIQFLVHILSHGIKIEFYEMKTFYKFKAVVGLAFGPQAKRPFGLIVGAGCDLNLTEALRKAFDETVRHVAFELFSPENMSSSGGPEIPAIISRHISGAMALEYLQDFLSLGLLPHGVASLGEMSEEISDDSFEVQAFDVDKMLSLKGCPLHVVQVSNSSLQPLFFGDATPTHINYKRLSEFAGRPFGWSDINKLLHPFG